MRFQASVTTVSWIPSESVPGIGKMVFASGVGHYDDRRRIRSAIWKRCTAPIVAASLITSPDGSR